jgi:hypothetical protein
MRCIDHLRDKSLIFAMRPQARLVGGQKAL